MAVPSSTRAVLLLAVVLAGAAAVAAASSGAASAPKDSDDAMPSILKPVAHTPLGSFEGADGPVADDATKDEEAGPVGSPIGTTMTEPEPELAPPAPPGDSSGATAASVLFAGPASAAALAAAAIFAF